MSIWATVCREEHRNDGSMHQEAETDVPSKAVLHSLRRTEAAEEAGHHTHAAACARQLLAAAHSGFVWSDMTRLGIIKGSEASCKHLDATCRLATVPDDVRAVQMGGHEEQAMMARKVLTDVLAGVEEHPQLAWLCEPVHFLEPLPVPPPEAVEPNRSYVAPSFSRAGTTVAPPLMQHQPAVPASRPAPLYPVRNAAPAAPQPILRNPPPPPLRVAPTKPPGVLHQPASQPAHQTFPSSHSDVSATTRGAPTSASAVSSLSVALRQQVAPVAPPPPVVQKDTTEGFVTAAQQLEIDVKRGRCPPSLAASLQTKPSLGLRRNNTPLHNNTNNNGCAGETSASTNNNATVGMGKVLSSAVNPKQAGGASKSNDDDPHDPSLYPPSLLLPDGSLPPILLPLDPKLVTQITYEIMERQCNVDWSDIAGLEFAKSSVEEAIVWPLRRPDLFVGLRDPPKGLLLFGPPGTGKTMIARAIASRAQCTFLNISSSSLMSKWVGDGEKMVRCMFAVAVVMQPSVIFIDEIDSLLSMRGEGEQDGVRRVKTEFLVQLDGVGTSASDRVLLIGATNRPEELDEAARRRMEKRLYIPLPDEPSRKELVRTLLSKGDFIHAIGDTELENISKMSEGYSGADLKNLCREAAMGPLRSAKSILSDVASADIRPVMLKDFNVAVRRVKPSVGQGELERYVKWNNQFGSFIEGEDGDDDEDDE